MSVLDFSNLVYTGCLWKYDLFKQIDAPHSFAMLLWGWKSGQDLGDQIPGAVPGLEVCIFRLSYYSVM